jgi:hypothetical protein
MYEAVKVEIYNIKLTILLQLPISLGRPVRVTLV